MDSRSGKPMVMYKKFLAYCAESLDQDAPKIMKILKMKYESCSQEMRSSDEMVHILEQTMDSMKREPSRAFVHLKDLVTQLKLWSKLKPVAKVSKPSEKMTGLTAKCGSEKDDGQGKNNDQEDLSKRQENGGDGEGEVKSPCEVRVDHDVSLTSYKASPIKHDCKVVLFKTDLAANQFDYNICSDTQSQLSPSKSHEVSIVNGNFDQAGVIVKAAKLQAQSNIQQKQLAVGDVRNQIYEKNSHERSQYISDSPERSTSKELGTGIFGTSVSSPKNCVSSPSQIEVFRRSTMILEVNSHSPEVQDIQNVLDKDILKSSKCKALQFEKGPLPLASKGSGKHSVDENAQQNSEKKPGHAISLEFGSNIPIENSNVQCDGEESLKNTLPQSQGPDSGASSCDSGQTDVYSLPGSPEFPSVSSTKTQPSSNMASSCESSQTEIYSLQDYPELQPVAQTNEQVLSNDASSCDSVATEMGSFTDTVNAPPVPQTDDQGVSERLCGSDASTIDLSDSYPAEISSSGAEKDFLSKMKSSNVDAVFNRDSLVHSENNESDSDCQRESLASKALEAGGSPKHSEEHYSLTGSARLKQRFPDANVLENIGSDTDTISMGRSRLPSSDDEELDTIRNGSDIAASAMCRDLHDDLSSEDKTEVKGIQGCNSHDKDGGKSETTITVNLSNSNKQEKVGGPLSKHADPQDVFKQIKSDSVVKPESPSLCNMSERAVCPPTNSEDREGLSFSDSTKCIGNKKALSVSSESDTEDNKNTADNKPSSDANKLRWSPITDSPLSGRDVQKGEKDEKSRLSLFKIAGPCEAQKKVQASLVAAEISPSKTAKRAVLVPYIPKIHDTAFSKKLSKENSTYQDNAKTKPSHSGSLNKAMKDIPGSKGSSSGDEFVSNTDAKQKQSSPQEKLSPEEEKRQRHVRKLEKLLESLKEEIEKCQARELSFDDMEAEDSSYIYEDKLKKKFVAVWNKLCEVTKRTVETGRPTERTIKFNSTRYKEINRRLERYLNKTKRFPDIHDVKHVIKITNTKHTLGLSSAMIQNIAREAFVDIGEMLQSRRHEDFIATFGNRHTDAFRMGAGGMDPYWTDPLLRKKLDSNRETAKYNLEKVIAKYTKLQETKGKYEEDDDDEEEEEEDYTKNGKERGEKTSRPKQRLEDADTSDSRRAKFGIDDLSSEEVADDNEETGDQSHILSSPATSDTPTEERKNGKSVTTVPSNPSRLLGPSPYLASSQPKDLLASHLSGTHKDKTSQDSSSAPPIDVDQDPDYLESAGLLTLPVNPYLHKKEGVSPLRSSSHQKLLNQASYSLPSSPSSVITIEDSPAKPAKPKLNITSGETNKKSGDESGASDAGLSNLLKGDASENLQSTSKSESNNGGEERTNFKNNDYYTEDVEEIEDQTSESDSDEKSDDDGDDDEDDDDIIMVASSAESGAESESEVSRGPSPVSVVSLDSDDDKSSQMVQEKCSLATDVKPSLASIEKLNTLMSKGEENTTHKEMENQSEEQSRDRASSEDQLSEKNKMLAALNLIPSAREPTETNRKVSCELDAEEAISVGQEDMSADTNETENEHSNTGISISLQRGNAEIAESSPHIESLSTESNDQTSRALDVSKFLFTSALVGDINVQDKICADSISSEPSKTQTSQPENPNTSFKDQSDVTPGPKLLNPKQASPLTVSSRRGTFESSSSEPLQGSSTGPQGSLESLEDEEMDEDMAEIYIDVVEDEDDEEETVNVCFENTIPYNLDSEDDECRIVDPEESTASGADNATVECEILNEKLQNIVSKSAAQMTDPGDTNPEKAVRQSVKDKVSDESYNNASAVGSVTDVSDKPCSPVLGSTEPKTTYSSSSLEGNKEADPIDVNQVETNVSKKECAMDATNSTAPNVTESEVQGQNSVGEELNTTTQHASLDTANLVQANTDLSPGGETVQLNEVCDEAPLDETTNSGLLSDQISGSEPSVAPGRRSETNDECAVQDPQVHTPASSKCKSHTGASLEITQTCPAKESHGLDDISSHEPASLAVEESLVEINDPSTSQQEIGEGKKICAKVLEASVDDDDMKSRHSTPEAGTTGSSLLHQTETETDAKVGEDARDRDIIASLVDSIMDTVNDVCQIHFSYDSNEETPSALKSGSGQNSDKTVDQEKSLVSKKNLPSPAPSIKSNSSHENAVGEEKVSALHVSVETEKDKLASSNATPVAEEDASFVVENSNLNKAVELSPNSAEQPQGASGEVEKHLSPNQHHSSDTSQHGFDQNVLDDGSPAYNTLMGNAQALPDGDAKPSGENQHDVGVVPPSPENDGVKSSVSSGLNEQNIGESKENTDKEEHLEPEVATSNREEEKTDTDRGAVTNENNGSSTINTKDAGEKEETSDLFDFISEICNTIIENAAPEDANPTASDSSMSKDADLLDEEKHIEAGKDDKADSSDCRDTNEKLDKTASVETSEEETKGDKVQEKEGGNLGDSEQATDQEAHSKEDGGIQELPKTKSSSASSELEDVSIIEELSDAKGVRVSCRSKEEDRKMVDALLTAIGPPGKKDQKVESANLNVPQEKSSSSAISEKETVEGTSTGSALDTLPQSENKSNEEEKATSTTPLSDPEESKATRSDTQQQNSSSEGENTDNVGTKNLSGETEDGSNCSEQPVEGSSTEPAQGTKDADSNSSSAKRKSNEISVDDTGDTCTEKGEAEDIDDDIAITNVEMAGPPKKKQKLVTLENDPDYISQIIKSVYRGIPPKGEAGPSSKGDSKSASSTNGDDDIILLEDSSDLPRVQIHPVSVHKNQAVGEQSSWNVKHRSGLKGQGGIAMKSGIHRTSAGPYSRAPGQHSQAPKIITAKPYIPYDASSNLFRQTVESSRNSKTLPYQQYSTGNRVSFPSAASMISKSKNTFKSSPLSSSSSLYPSTKLNPNNSPYRMENRTSFKPQNWSAGDPTFSAQYGRDPSFFQSDRRQKVQQPSSPHPSLNDMGISRRAAAQVATPYTFSRGNLPYQHLGPSNRGVVAPGNPRLPNSSNTFRSVSQSPHKRQSLHPLHGPPPRKARKNLDGLQIVLDDNSDEEDNSASSAERKSGEDSLPKIVSVCSLNKPDESTTSTASAQQKSPSGPTKATEADQIVLSDSD